LVGLGMIRHSCISIISKNGYRKYSFKSNMGVEERVLFGRKKKYFLTLKRNGKNKVARSTLPHPIVNRSTRYSLNIKMLLSFNAAKYLFCGIFYS
jgi:hypothetical protein